MRVESLIGGEQVVDSKDETYPRRELVEGRTPPGSAMRSSLDLAAGWMVRQEERRTRRRYWTSNPRQESGLFEWREESKATVERR
jgi:hypothetical protein